MSFLDLRYLASREWMEAQILSGHAIQNREQVLSVDPETVDEALRARIAAIQDQVMWLTVEKKKRACVLDSGIDPELSFGKSKKSLVPMDKPVLNEIGELPELQEPTDNPEAVVEAWEEWVQLYIQKGLSQIEGLSSNPPSHGKDLFTEKEVEWGPLGIRLAEDLKAEISLADGPEAIRDVRAGRLWRWAANRRFSSDSVAVAKEAISLSPKEAHEWLRELDSKELAARYLEFGKKQHRAAKAHDAARGEKVPGFEVEMRRWAEEQGSDRLRLGLEDGYRMNSRYLTERIASEAPGMFAMPASSATEDWATKAASPSEAALRLRRRVEAAMLRNAPPNMEGPSETEIMIVKKPPPDIYYADPGVHTEDGRVGADLPRRDGWPWHLDEYDEPVGSSPLAFEAVVVKHWLGRFHLIGAVADREGPPPGVWAVPNLEHFGEDGTVLAQDPDDPTPIRARRKPPELTEKESDIPF